MALITLLPLFLVLISASTVVGQAGNVSFTFPPQDNMKTYKDAYILADTIELTNSRPWNSPIQFVSPPQFGNPFGNPPPPQFGNPPPSQFGNPESSFGWATHNEPIPIWDSSTKSLANFSSHFQFLIDNIGINHPGHGLTFFMAPFDAEPPINAFSQRLGLFNSTIDGDSTNQIVAVAFDTFQHYLKPDCNHVRVDVNSIFSAKIVSVRDNEELWNGEKWDAWVDYNGGTKMIEVFLLYNPSGNNISKPGKPILSYEIDLSRIVPENVRVGLSASTGTAYAINRIYFWKFLSQYPWNNSTGSPVNEGNNSSQYSWNNSTGSPVNEGNNSSSVRVALISALAILFALCGFIFVAVMWYRRRRKSSGDARKESDVELDEWFSQGPRRFSYAELSAATRNFSEDEKLGQGGFGGVYRGILPGMGEAVAVKRIAEGSKQGRKEYVSEVTTIGKLRHRNLVQLLGWCHEQGKLLVVYEFLPNGSLDNYLFGNRNFVLNWGRRYSIACDIASALVYLHEDCEQRVVHRDVKASNVMLDSDFNAKLGDFGLARLMGRDHEASSTTVVAGTFGYLAPECVYTQKASTESDVFSFGAVTLEIACGRQPLDPSLGKRLVEWVWDLYGQARLLDAADHKLDGNFIAYEMERLLLLGLLCSHPDPKARPKMREALNMLKLEVHLPNVPLKLPAFAIPHSLLSSSMPTKYGASLTSTSSSITGPSVSSSSSMHASFSSSSTGSRNEVISKPLLHRSENHAGIVIGSRAEFKSV